MEGGGNPRDGGPKKAELSCQRPIPKSSHTQKGPSSMPTLGLTSNDFLGFFFLFSFQNILIIQTILG